MKKIYKLTTTKEEQVDYMELTASIRKGDKHYVALCLELDIVSQGKTPQSALKNLKEAVELYVEEMGFPRETKEKEPIITRFALKENAKVA